MCIDGPRDKQNALYPYRNRTATKRGHPLTPAARWMNPVDAMLRETNQKQNETESR